MSQPFKPMILTVPEGHVDGAAIMQVVALLHELYPELIDAAADRSQLVSQSGAMADKDESAVRADARFIIDSKHLMRSMQRAVHDLITMANLQMERMQMDKPYDRTQARSGELLTDLRHLTTRLSAMLDQNSELITQEALRLSARLHLMRSHLVKIESTLTQLSGRPHLGGLAETKAARAAGQSDGPGQDF